MIEILPPQPASGCLTRGRSDPPRQAVRSRREELRLAPGTATLIERLRPIAFWRVVCIVQHPYFAAIRTGKNGRGGNAIEVFVFEREPQMPPVDRSSLDERVA